MFAGLLASTLFGAWWLDGAVALAIAVYSLAQPALTGLLAAAEDLLVATARSSPSPPT